MLSRQVPQQVPARVRRATSFTVEAPSSIARAMAVSLTELQTHTIIGLLILKIVFNSSVVKSRCSIFRTRPRGARRPPGGQKDKPPWTSIVVPLK